MRRRQGSASTVARSRAVDCLPKRSKWAELPLAACCASTTARLRLALANQERDMEALRGQHALAGHGQGWVLEALNRYQIGFGKGLREALEFELLGH